MLKTFQLRNYNFKLVILLSIITFLGVVFVNSANPSYTKKHLIGLFGTFIIMVIVSLIDYNFIIKLWPILYGAEIVVLALVKLVGYNVNGATRWFKIPGLGMTIQPSEFAKIILIISVAAFLEKHKEDLNTLLNLFKLALLCAFQLFFIAIEPDLSTCLDIVLILLCVIFIGGLSYRIVGTALAIVVPLLALFLYYVDHAANVILLKDYQVRRIKTFLHPSEYGTTQYQQANSVMAIGSGMLKGKGFSSNVTTVKDAKLIPEQQTDFIFSVVGEEYGFIGCMIVIAILLLIVLQCLRVARRARNTSGKLIATGIGSMICIQAFINIGVATNILPNTGLPLPFVSYGLSSLLSCMIGMGLVLNIGLQKRKY